MLLKTKLKLAAVALLAAVISIYWLVPEENLNRMSRTIETYTGQDYLVTYSEDAHLKSWKVIDGKVTSEGDKGYYYFWATDEDGDKLYVQTPIERTYIEEVK